jgi:CspA family cold shock protein
MPTGSVKWFSSTRGFGFIAPDGGGKDIVLQSAAEERAGPKSLNDTRKLACDLPSGRDGRGSAGELRLLWRGADKGRPQGRPDRKAGKSFACACRVPCVRRGPKPPASARPAPGGRASPAGSGAGLRCAWTCRSSGNRRARVGKRRAFPGPARTDVRTFAAAMAGAIAPATSARHPHAGGPKPPASARPAHGGRFSPAGPGAGLCWCGWRGSWWQRSARAGKRSTFPVPARTGGGRSESETPTPLLWQGPSPLPQRCADPMPAGGPKPPASARPAHGGRFPPAGSGAGLRCAWTCRSTGNRLARAGKRMRFLVPPAPTYAHSPLLWQGPSPLPQRHIDPTPAGGPKPPASARPAPGGRWPLLVRVAWVFVAASRAGWGNAMRFLIPPGEAVFLSVPGSPAHLAGAIAPATAPR